MTMATTAIDAVAEMIAQIYVQQRTDYDADLAEGEQDGPPAPVLDDIIKAQASWYGLDSDDLHLRLAVQEHLRRLGVTQAPSTDIGQ
jgi:hypothetical protein